MRRLVLYTKQECPLCEEARELVQYALRGRGVQLEEVDISDNKDLMARFGTLIPVIVWPDSGAQLQWPFGPADVFTLLEESRLEAAPTDK